MNRLISISGYAQSGKDTVAKIIQLQHATRQLPDYWPLEDKLSYIDTLSQYTVVSWADNLRKCAEIITGVPAWLWKNIDTKMTPVPGFNITGREFLQNLGTAVRAMNEDAWINSMMKDYRDQYWVIPDTRYVNEAMAVKQFGGVCLRVVRPGTEPANKHESETAMDNFAYDAVIVNDGTLADLESKVRTCLNKLNVCIL